MSGGLLQLVTYGEQDVYLTGDPEVTNFKMVFKRYTNFVIENIEQEFNSDANFGKLVSSVIARNADLVHKMYVRINLPSVVPEKRFIGQQATVKTSVKKNVITCVELVDVNAPNSAEGTQFFNGDYILFPFDNSDLFYGDGYSALIYVDSVTDKGDIVDITTIIPDNLSSSFDSSTYSLGEYYTTNNIFPRPIQQELIDSFNDMFATTGSDTIIFVTGINPDKIISESMIINGTTGQLLDFKTIVDGVNYEEDKYYGLTPINPMDFFKISNRPSTATDAIITIDIINNIGGILNTVIHDMLNGEQYNIDEIFTVDLMDNTEFTDFLNLYIPTTGKGKYIVVTDVDSDGSIISLRTGEVTSTFYIGSDYELNHFYKLVPFQLNNGVSIIDGSEISNKATFDITTAGSSVIFIALNNAGSGYVVGDTYYLDGTIFNYSNLAFVQVDTVGISGEILTFTLLTPGFGYSDSTQDLLSLNTAIFDITTLAGEIVTIVLNNGGKGYSINEIYYLNGIIFNLQDLAIIRIDDVDNNGTILTFTLLSTGQGYVDSSQHLIVLNNNDFTDIIADITPSGFNDGCSIIKPLINDTFQVILGGGGYSVNTAYELIPYEEMEFEEKFRPIGGGDSTVRVEMVNTGAVTELSILFEGADYETDKFYKLGEINISNYPFKQGVGECSIVTTENVIIKGDNYGLNEVYMIDVINPIDVDTTIGKPSDELSIVQVISLLPLQFRTVCGGNDYDEKKAYILVRLEDEIVKLHFIGSGTNGVLTISNVEEPTIPVSGVPFADGSIVTPDVTILNGGCNYNVDEIYLLLPKDSDVSDLYINNPIPACVRIKTVDNIGIDKIIIDDPGNLYICPPTVLVKGFDIDGELVCLELESEIENGELCNIIIPDDFSDLTDISVEITGGHFVNSFSWIRKLGHFLIDFVEVEIGGQIIDKHYGDWLNIWFELTVPNMKIDGYNKMIGNVKQLFDTKVSDRINNSVSDRILYIPLQFWFCRYVGASLPIMALQYHEVRINIKFRSLEEVTKYGPEYFAKIRLTPPFSTAGSFNIPINGPFDSVKDIDINVSNEIGSSLNIVNNNTTSIIFPIFNENDIILVSTLKKSKFIVISDNFIFILTENATILQLSDISNNTEIEMNVVYYGVLSSNSFTINVGDTIVKKNVIIDDIVFDDVVSYSEIEQINENSKFIYFNYKDTDLEDILKYKVGDELVLGDDITRITIDEEPILVPHELYPIPRFQDACILTDYIYLDTDERERFAKNSHEYLVDLLQFNGPDQIFDCVSGIQLRFDNPCKELIWVTQLKLNINRNDYDNYTDEVNFFGNNPIVDSFLRVNGNKRFSNRFDKYFNFVQPYQHHTRTPIKGINVYSFSLKPEEQQPSGTINMSRVDELTLFVNYDPTKIRNNDQAEIRVYSFFYNILRVSNGMGGLAFGN